MPTDSHPIAGFPGLSALSDGVDHAHDFVAGRARVDDSREEAILGHRIAMTNAAGLNFHSDVSGGGLTDRLFNQFKVSTGAFYLDFLHERNLT
jgi:hypothetical protein